MKRQRKGERKRQVGGCVDATLATLQGENKKLETAENGGKVEK